jgi:hypothetical protein
LADTEDEVEKFLTTLKLIYPPGITKKLSNPTAFYTMDPLILSKISTFSILQS